LKLWSCSWSCLWSCTKRAQVSFSWTARQPTRNLPILANLIMQADHKRVWLLRAWHVCYSQFIYPENSFRYRKTIILSKRIVSTDIHTAPHEQGDTPHQEATGVCRVSKDYREPWRTLPRNLNENLAVMTQTIGDHADKLFKICFLI
jgi:hypothetical protein